MKIFRSHTFVHILCIVCLLGVGFLAFNDYGISSDEPAMYTFGVQVYAYLFMNGPIPAVQDWLFHNPIFHVLLVAIQRIFGFTSAQNIWLMRHAVTFLLFVCGVWVFYDLARRIFGNRYIALIGATMLVLSPRIFAHAFFNPKDIPTLVFFLFAMATLFACRRNNYSWKWLTLHALTCALIISIRSFGYLIPALTLLALCIDAFRKHTIVSTVQRLIFFVIALLVCLVAVWPLLWIDPFTHFVSSFAESTGHAGGAFLPWHYIPVWIVVTTPLVYSALFMVGLVTVLRQRIDLDWMLILLWMFVTPIVLVLLKLHIFDGWRHLYFLYPAYLLIALRGLMALVTVRQQWLRNGAVIVTSTSMLWIALWMIGNHPFQYAYFSFPKQVIEGKFDVDYWGVSYYKGLEWVLQHDARSVIPVYTEARAGQVSADLFPLKEWGRLRFVNASSADYILQSFRRKEFEQLLPDERILHTIDVGGITLLAIYEGPDTQDIFRQHSE